jgi:hypothetical protein
MVAFFLLSMSLVVGQITDPPQFTIPCVVTSGNYPSSMTCIPSRICSDGLISCTGVCFTTPPSLPFSACYVSNSVTTCGQAIETCSPFYAACQTANCLGNCVTTTPPKSSCVVGESPSCPTGLTCTLIEILTLSSP